jgi:asparagine N-glycosylation enzyme membrane subunit Stt3
MTDIPFPSRRADALRRALQVAVRALLGLALLYATPSWACMVGPGKVITFLRKSAPRVVPKGMLVLKIRVTASSAWTRQSRFMERAVPVVAVASGSYAGRMVDIEDITPSDCDRMGWAIGDWYVVGRVHNDRAGKPVFRPVEGQ